MAREPARDSRATPRAQTITAGMADVVETIAHLRRSLRRSQLANLACGATALVLLVVCLALLLFRPRPVYFALDQDMQLLPMTPLSEPLVNDAALEAWLAAAVTDAFNMDFVNWRQRLANARQYFSDGAFEGYLASLDTEAHIKVLTQYKAIMHAIPASPPLIVQRGVVGAPGVMTWDLQLELIVNYETSAKRIASQKVDVACRVQRMPTTEYPAGIAIVQLVAKTGGPVGAGG
jgi:hypothetical protein